MRASGKKNIGMHCILASLYFLMLPLTISVNSGGASFLKLATIPIAIYFVISLLFYKKPFHINIVHIILASFTMVTVVTMFVNPTQDNFYYVMGYFLNAALFICLSVVEYNEKELELLEFVQVVLLVVIIFITLYNDATAHGRTTLEIFGQKCDPNYYVGFFIFPLTVTMKKIFSSKYRIVYAIITLLAVYSIFLSGSRGGLLAIISTIIAFAVIYPKKVKSKALILLCMLISVVILWNVIKPFLSDTVVERMSVEAVIESRGTHRLDTWLSMLEEIKESDLEIFFGRGMSSLHPMVIAGKKHLVVAHNHLIQLLYDQGMVGVLSFVTLFGCCFFRCIKKRKSVAIALVGMLALSVSLTFNPNTKFFWNLVPYAAFTFAEAQSEDNKISNKSDDPTFKEDE